jgi:hypothetical protein
MQKAPIRTDRGVFIADLPISITSAEKPEVDTGIAGCFNVVADLPRPMLIVPW